MNQHPDHARLLAGERVPVNANDPISGYFRTKRVKDGPYLPIKITRVPGDFEDSFDILLNGRPSTTEGIGWPYPARHPITKEAYDYFMAEGRWRDIDDVVERQQNGNNAPTDPDILLAEQIEAAKAGAKAYAKIEDDETATRAQTLRSRLLELSGQADKARVAEKEPHLSASRDVDAKWQPLVKDAKATADMLRASLSDHETRKLQARRAEEKLAQEAAERERKAILADAEAMAAQTGKPVVIEAIAPLPVQPAAPAKIKGAAGRAASVSTVRVVHSVTDFQALALHFREYPEVKALLVKFANEQLKLGNQVPGIVTQEVAAVR
jgi:hypothetical protein